MFDVQRGNIFGNRNIKTITKRNEEKQKTTKAHERKLFHMYVPSSLQFSELLLLREEFRDICE